jgi:hypothetical protein
MKENTQRRGLSFLAFAALCASSVLPACHSAPLQSTGCRATIIGQIRQLCSSHQVESALFQLDASLEKYRWTRSERIEICQIIKASFQAKSTALPETLAGSLPEIQLASLRALIFQLLGELGQKLPAPAQERARLLIVRALSEEEGLALSGAILAAGMIGGQTALAALESIHDAWFQPARRLQVVRALAYQRSQPRARVMLRSRLDDWNQDVREEAFEVLLSSRQTKGRRKLALRALLEESETVVLAGVAVISSAITSHEARALMQRFKDKAPVNAAAAEEIFALLSRHGPVEFLSTAMAWGVGGQGDYEIIYQRAVAERKAFELLRHCMTQGPKARRFAYLKLFQRGSEETGFAVEDKVKIALRILDLDSQRENVLNAIHFLRSELESVFVRDALYDALSDHSLPSVRLEAARTLCAYPSRERDDAVERALKDRSKKIRHYCLSQLALRASLSALRILCRQVGAFAEDREAVGQTVCLLVQQMLDDPKKIAAASACQRLLALWAKSRSSDRARFANRGLSAFEQHKTRKP